MLSWKKHLKAPLITSLYKGLKKFMSGSEEAYHDGPVPFKNQWCRGESLEDISTFSRDGCRSNIERGNMDYVMPGKPHNVEIYIVKEYVFHGKAKFTTCFAEFTNPKMLQGNTLYEIEEVQSKVIEWLNTIMPKETNVKQ